MKFSCKIKWLATTVTLCGAVATVFRFDPLNIILLNMGSALFLLWGYLIRDKAMIAVNSGLLFIYIFGFLVRT